MLKPIDGLPANVIGFEAVGEVHSVDYKSVLDPAIQEALQQNDTLRLLYVLGEEFDSYSGGAMWEDTKLGMTDWSRWERIALVTDRRLFADGVKAFAWLIPAEVRVFPDAEFDAAKAWVSG